MIRSAIVLCSVSSLVLSLPQNLPQPGDGCGNDRVTGLARREGDSWSPDGCNNCRCLAGDRAGCTRRLCGDRATWEAGRTCSEGARWEEKTGGKIQVCTCEDGEPECNSLVIITEPPEVRCLDDEDGSHAVGESWEQEGGICTCQEDGTVDCSSEAIRSTTQCLDNEGGARSVGEVWDVECNTCRCTENGLAACTLKLCGFGFAAASPQCQDRNGESRQVGEEWKEGCNTCRCGENGVPGCTKKICPSECIDRLGETRTEGEEWFVERAGRNNQCQCLSGNVFCVAESDSVTAPVIPSIRVSGDEEETGSKINFPEERRAAAGVRSSRRGGEALLRIVDEASQASQCREELDTKEPKQLLRSDIFGIMPQVFEEPAMQSFATLHLLFLCKAVF